MTETKRDPYRVMAEVIWEHINGKQIAIHPDTIEVIAEAIRNHTVVPEMVECFDMIGTLNGNLSLDKIKEVNGINEGRDRAIKLHLAIESARNMLAKAEGGER